MVKIYDTIIIGGGAAALAASIYAARQQINFLLIAKEIGGQTLWSSDIQNYLGFKQITGVELIQKFKEHIEENKVPLKLEEVSSIQKKDKNFLIKTDKSEYQTKTVLITSGKKPRKLNIPGESEFLGKGVAYCALCDAPLFKNKDVAVIGGGNSALDAALLLQKYANKIYIININPEIKGEAKMLEEAKTSKKITIINSAITKQTKGKVFVSSINIEVQGKLQELPLQGIFVEIGSLPAVDFDNLTQKNRWSEIIIHDDPDKQMTNLTSVPGVFAAGDVTSMPEKQIIVAAGEGVAAILSIFKYLSK